MINVTPESLNLLINYCPKLEHILIGLGLHLDTYPTDELISSFASTIGKNRNFSITFDVNNHYPSLISNEVHNNIKQEYTKIKYIINHTVDFN